MLVKLKHEPNITLAQLLKRRKRSLKQFVEEFGITTYAGLHSRCERMGVVSPSEDDFMLLCIPVVSDPTEGVIVVDVTPDITPRKKRKKDALQEDKENDDS